MVGECVLLFGFDGFFGAVGADDYGVVELTAEVADDAVDVFAAESVLLGFFLGGQAFGFGFFCEKVDSLDFLFGYHNWVCQSIGVSPCLIKKSLHFEKCLHPKNPL